MANTALRQRQEERSLQADAAGLALLGDRLREANRANPEFDSQYDRLAVSLASSVE